METQTQQVLQHMAWSLAVAVDAYPVTAMRLGQLLMGRTEAGDPEGTPAALEDLRALGREYGTVLCGLARSLQSQHQAWQQLPEDDNPLPLLPLARELGQCYLLISHLESLEGGEHLPLVSQEELEGLVTPEVQAWMVRHGESSPE